MEQAELKRKLEKTKGKALAAGTISNVLIQWRAFNQFCKKFDRTEWPSNTETLCLFAQHLAERMRSVKSIESYLLGAVKLHRYAGETPPDIKSFDVQLTLKGLARKKKHRVRQAKPITPGMLLAIRDQLNFSRAIDVVFWTALLTSFFLLLRKSNIVPINRRSFDPRRQLTRQQIQLTKEWVKIKIYWSKTIQFHQRKLVYKLHRMKHSKLCPVAAFKKMFQLVQGTPQDPCFLCEDGFPLSYSMFKYRLKKYLKQAGVKTKCISAHSLRRGGLQWGYEMGIDKKLLKAMGDWKSECYEVYLSFLDRIRQKALELFREGLLRFEFPLQN